MFKGYQNWEMLSFQTESSLLSICDSAFSFLYLGPKTCQKWWSNNISIKNKSFIYKQISLVSLLDSCLSSEKVSCIKLNTRLSRWQIHLTPGFRRGYRCYLLKVSSKYKIKRNWPNKHKIWGSGMKFATSLDQISWVAILYAKVMIVSHSAFTFRQIFLGQLYSWKGQLIVEVKDCQSWDLNWKKLRYLFGNQRLFLQPKRSSQLESQPHLPVHKNQRKLWQCENRGLTMPYIDLYNININNSYNNTSVFFYFFLTEYLMTIEIKIGMIRKVDDCIAIRTCNVVYWKRVFFKFVNNCCLKKMFVF